MRHAKVSIMINENDTTGAIMIDMSAGFQRKWNRAVEFAWE